MGDTIIAQLSGLPYHKDYLDRVKLDYPWDLKLVDFYYCTREQQQHTYQSCIKPWLNQHRFVGVHRFEQFDFQSLDTNILVISIDPMACIDHVVNLYLTKVQSELGYSKTTDQLLSQHSADINRALATKRITQWRDTNILSSDIVFDLNAFLQDSNYCNTFADLLQ